MNDSVASQETKRSGAGVLAALSAIGGILGGAASVIALFMAKPETITVIVPVQRLERVVEEAKSAVAAAAPVAANTSAPQAVASAPAPAVAMLAWDAPRGMGEGLSASLVAVAEAADRFVASIRFVNSGAVDKYIALRGANPYVGEVNLTDGFGGSCPLKRDNAVGFGTLQSVPGTDPNVINAYRNQFVPIAAGGSVVQTLIFNKSTCDAPASGAHPLSVSATFIVLEGDKARTASASFESAVAAHAPAEG